MSCQKVFFYFDGEIQQGELSDDKWKIHCRRSTSDVIPENLMQELKQFLKTDFRSIENWKLKPGVAGGYKDFTLDSQDVFQGYLVIHF
jgi:hypothetical protein